MIGTTSCPVVHRGPAAWARQPLIWGVACFLAVQITSIGILEWKMPEFFDPKYGCRLNKLRSIVSAEPGLKVAIILGSSRAEQGFRPSLLVPARCLGGRNLKVTRSCSPAPAHFPVSHTSLVPDPISSFPAPSMPLLYNFARGGSSPLLHLLTLKRLLADGIHPEWIFLEIFPPSLVDDQTETTLAKTTVRDFGLVGGHPVNWLTYAYFVRDRLLLWTRYRTGLLATLDAACIPRGNRWETLWNPRTGEWQVIGKSISPEQLLEEAADARRRYQKKLCDLKIAPGADRATRAILELSRQHDIRMILFMMPESSEFRSWYTPASGKRISDYLSAICSRYDLPLIDARTWIADEDFWDGHHLLLHGAMVFMQRFSTDVLSRIMPKDFETSLCEPR